MTATSFPGAGFTVTVRLPIAAEPESEDPGGDPDAANLLTREPRRKDQRSALTVGRPAQPQSARSQTHRKRTAGPEPTARGRAHDDRHERD